MSRQIPFFLRRLGQSWFPIVLTSLLILALPGFILFFLTLTGREATINRWLQDRFQLSYHIPLPLWAAVILFLVPFAIALLYFLKLKRKPLSVPSTFLWKKSIEDLHVNSLFQWLRENVLLLLQLLAVVFLLYGIMAFQVHGQVTEGKHYIIIIDNSASMSATDVEPNRLEWAKQEALKEVETVSSKDVGMVIEFNSSAAIKQSFTSNQVFIRQAIKDIRATQRPTRIEEALSLAESLANPRRSTEDVASRPPEEEAGKERTYAPVQGIPTEVHLFSDGRFPDVPDFALGNLDMHYHTAGKLIEDVAARPPKEGEAAVPNLKAASESKNNLAIVSFNALRDETDPTKYLAFVRAMNFRSEDANPKIRLEVLVNGKIKSIYEKSIHLPANKRTSGELSQDSPETAATTPGEATATFSLLDIDEQASVILHAKLVDNKDIFPLDDEGWMVLGIVRKAKVLIVGRYNQILHALFDDRSAQGVAKVTYLQPEDLEKNPYLSDSRNGVYDLIFFDRCGPKAETDMPRANTFFIGYPPPPWEIRKLQKLSNPIIRGWMTKHPLLRDLSTLNEIGLSEAFKMDELPPRTPKLIETDRDTPLLLTLSRGSFTDLVMTFAPLNDRGEFTTNWPLQPSFPLFLRNVVYNLGNVQDAATEETVQPGKVKTIRPEDPVKRIEVSNPEGIAEVLSHGDNDLRVDFSYGNTELVGVYGVKWENRVQRRFTVNLFDPEESDVEPRPAIQIGTERLVSGKERSEPHEVWKWFAFMALVALLLEWYIYNRRIYI